jgi:hypothetical protein
MSSSPNFGITLLAESQSSKYLTVNDAVVELEAALSDVDAITMTDADYTPTATEGGQAFGNLVLNFSATLTGARNIILPAKPKLYVVKNSTTGGFKLTVKTSGGTGIDVHAADGYVLLYCDGTNVVAIGVASGGSGATAFTGLSDVPGSYSGADGFAVQVNAGGSALEFKAKSFDVAVFAPGVPVASQKLARIPLARAVVFPSGAAASVAKAGTAATASTTFTLSKNGSAFATVVFAISGTTGTWTQALDATFAAGDVLEIDAPGSPDATLADIGITLAGTRT